MKSNTPWQEAAKGCNGLLLIKKTCIALYPIKRALKQANTKTDASRGTRMRLSAALLS